MCSIVQLTLFSETRQRRALRFFTPPTVILTIPEWLELIRDRYLLSAGGFHIHRGAFARSRSKPREQLALRRGKGPVGAVPGAGAVGRYNAKVINSVRS